MAHAPTTPAVDDRPVRFLERAEVPEEHRARLQDLVRHVQALAADAGIVDELQSSFGADHVAMIHDCNQFLRCYKRGEAAGRAELLLEDPDKEALAAAGFTLHEAQGMVFRMFGWTGVDPMEGDPEALQAAVAAAYAKAQGGGSVPAGPGKPL